MQELSSPRSRPQRSYRARGDRHLSGYVWERDFPKGLQDKGGESVMDFDFRLTDDEIDAFYTEVGNRLNGALPLRLKFGPDRASFSVRKQRHSKALSAKRVQIAQFMAQRVRVQYVPAVRDARIAGDIVRELVSTAVRTARQGPEFDEALAEIRRLQQPVLDSLAAAIFTRLQHLVPKNLPRRRRARAAESTPAPPPTVTVKAAQTRCTVSLSHQLDGQSPRPATRPAKRLAAYRWRRPRRLSHRRPRSMVSGRPMSPLRRWRTRSAAGRAASSCASGAAR
jgi:hypothetical protein